MNMRTSLLVGLLMAAGYSAYAILLFVLEGPEVFARHETTLMAAIGTYFVAGIGGGGVVGVLMPMTRSVIGRVMVGIVVAFVVFLCIGISVDGPAWRWRAANWANVVIASVFMGVACSLLWGKLISRP